MSISASEIAKMTGGDDVATKRKVYTEEYRNEAVEYYEKAHADSGKSTRQCAADLGINPKTLNDRVIKKRGTGRVSQARDEAQVEADRLKRENAELREQVEFLKKAAAFFARTQA